MTMRVAIWTIVLTAAVLDVDAKPSKQSQPPDCSTTTDGTLIADETSCYMYFMCSGGSALIQSCGAGLYFNKTTLQCVTDTANICPESGCSTDGTVIPSPSGCALFYVCHSSKNVEQSCEAGSYFNKIDLACLPDPNNTCPESACSADGVIFPHPTECNLFYVCYNGIPVEQSCGNGSYFDKNDLYCVPDTGNICSPTTPSPPCTCEGELTPNPSNCSSYYNCTDGLLVQQSCGYGNFFESCTKTCEKDTCGNCWPVTATCSGGLEENDVGPVADKCYAYVKCIQGKLVEERCAQGSFFNSTIKSCTVDENNICLLRHD